MQPSDQDIRAFLITEAFRFVDQIILLPGIQRIAMLGSLTTAKTNPKDIDILITVDDDTDLTKLATAARRLKGIAQSKNKGADIFLANTKGQYIGRVCQWRNCGPHFRTTCNAYHCGQRHYLHDDFGDITLASDLVKEPPLEI